jgi:hypothetical protein
VGNGEAGPVAREMKAVETFLFLSIEESDLGFFEGG